jgi:uncharacterized membrane protein YraQ (UPF0718 family)
MYLSQCISGLKVTYPTGGNTLYVEIGTTSSAPVTLSYHSYGFPYGSVLSLFLFNIYTDSMSSVPKVVVLNRMLATRKHFYRLHYRILLRIKRIYTEFLNRVVTTVFL